MNVDTTYSMIAQILRQHKETSHQDNFENILDSWLSHKSQCDDESWKNSVKELWVLPGPLNQDLMPHQLKAIRSCIKKVIIPNDITSGFCFMPTSSGKGHVLLALAGLAVHNFTFQRIYHSLISSSKFSLSTESNIDFEFVENCLIYLGLQLEQHDAMKVHVMVHDIDILDQIKKDGGLIIGKNICSHLEFKSVQSYRNESRRENIDYVLIDECHWGNANEEETVQSSLIKSIKNSSGKAIGFTASPYNEGKFLNSWSNLQFADDFSFKYFLNEKILFPVTLSEVSLQNARTGFNEGDEEVDLIERPQIIDFMSDTVSNTLGPIFHGPGICFFSASIIPDFIESFIQKRPEMKHLIKVIGSEDAKFIQKCKEKFSSTIIADKQDIDDLKKGKNIFLLSRQKLLVGLNAPHLKYCFISPTNSKITIMQAVGRLMRIPPEGSVINKKIATLFMTSLSGKTMHLSSKTDSKEEDAAENENEKPYSEDDETHPDSTYVPISMSFSEAYSLSSRVHYKTEVGFLDFITESKINDSNAVTLIGRTQIDKNEFDSFDPIPQRTILQATRNQVRAIYRPAVALRDVKDSGSRRVWCCQGKRLFGMEGCDRTTDQVQLEIHHIYPYEFHKLITRLGVEGTKNWHSDARNLKHLVTLCTNCHDLAHQKTRGQEQFGAAKEYNSKEKTNV
jgi:superfamily II DNA or RNA helicase